MNSRPSDFDLKAFLHRFGLFIYTGDPEGDLLLIEDEIRELYELNVIDKEEFMEAMSAVRSRRKADDR
ncbi:YqgQ family protein [Brevibacillus choshinensis]|uniref:YqgQ family protein n=1 Tax=Brevibacillus choshinensis TaxID=54911 RepID=UPI002E1A766D|nr:YqgQ family protein [Brevibacillus choshinensis]MED4752966.1 YqgQ family protein [Brevibacillus choshinensis]MED4781458.1 YqgQ family protein [Brevibacillus choshinensis]